MARAEFVATLASCIDDVGTVVTWCRRLEPTLRQIMEDVPSLKNHIRSLLQMDPIALDHLVKEGAYHPAQHGSFQLHTVHAALTGTEPPPDDNAIHDEESARAAFAKLSSTRTRSATRNKLRAELTAYGRQQSEWMLEIYKKLAGPD